MQSSLNGTVFSHILDGWDISWESSGVYRHWCHQIKSEFWPNLLVIMFNPGSLSGDGKNLRRDTTLRILREVCDSGQINPFVTNLFDYASPSPSDLFVNWNKRDAECLVFDLIGHLNFAGYIMAYGDYENCGQRDQEIKDRSKLVRTKLVHLKEISLPKNKSGTPKHPMIWQRQNLKPEIVNILIAGLNNS
jgi:hypothetical protein